MPGHNMAGLVAHDCCNLVLGLQELQQASLEDHLASRRHKGIDIARLINHRKLPLQILRTRYGLLSGNPCQKVRATFFTYHSSRYSTSMNISYRKADCRDTLETVQLLLQWSHLSHEA